MYDNKAGDHFDLSPIESELESLEEAVNALYKQIETDNINPRPANEAIKMLSRRLIPLDYTTSGRFQQDPAKTRPSYPKIVRVLDLAESSGNEYKFQQRNLKRAVNEIVHQLRSARRNIPVK